MPSLNKIATITNAGDNDPNPTEVIPGTSLLLIGWYRDISYGSDEYGCTSIPNIFHMWLVDIEQIRGKTPPNVPHANVLGVECHPYWVWGNAIYTRRQGRDLLIIGGGRYVGANNIYKRIVIVDISNPSSPQVLKLLEDNQSVGTANHIVYDKDTDNLLVVDYAGNLRADTLANILNYTSFSQIPVIRTGIDPWGVIPIGNRYIRYVVGDTVYARNIDTGQETQIPNETPIYNSAKYTITATVDQSTGTITGISIRDPDTLGLIRSVSINKKPYRAWWDVGTVVTKEIAFIHFGNSFILLDLSTGQILVDAALPQNIWNPGFTQYENLYRGRLIVWGGANPASGDLYELVPDKFIDILYDAATKRVRLVDSLGNPVANATVYIRKRAGVSWQFGALVSGPLITRTSDSQGYVDVSDLVGIYKIEA